MSVTSLEPIASFQITPFESLLSSDKSAVDFPKLLVDEMAKVNQSILLAERSLRDLAAGNTENLHQIMISMEEAKLSFQLMLQMRNKVLEAYQEVLRMQI